MTDCKESAGKLFRGIFSRKHRGSYEEVPGRGLFSRKTSGLNEENPEFYFAALDDKIIGYLKLNFGPSQTELKDYKALEIERIYVLQEFHGKNVGRLLYEKAMQIARQINADYVPLGVWERNSSAIDFYRKNAFVAFDRYIFKLGNDEQTDIMMKLRLKD